MVQILMATFNGEKYISQQLDSILNQTYHDIQILIRDDGSSDNTVEIIEGYVQSYPEKIVLIKDDEKCGSAASNFMQLTKYATADYIMYSDQDDYWFPNKVEEMLRVMKQNEEENAPLLVYSDYIATDSKLIPLKVKKKKDKKEDKLNRLLVQNHVSGCTVMVNKKMYQNAITEPDFILMHDWWITICAVAFGKIIKCEQPLMYYRQHDDNCVGEINTGSWKYFKSRLMDEKYKRSMETYILQAQGILQLQNVTISEDDRRCIESFVNIQNQNKLRRVVSLIKGGYLKTGILRKIGQILYI